MARTLDDGEIVKAVQLGDRQPGADEDSIAPLLPLEIACDFVQFVQAAALLGTPLLVARATADPRYRAEHNRALPRKIGSHLALFDCINCDKCLPACPNDANFVYETRALRAEYPAFRVSAGAVVAEAAGVLEVKKAHQIAKLSAKSASGSVAANEFTNDVWCWS